MGRAEDIFDRLIKEGEAAIDEFIATRQSEELFLEFKRSADNGASTKLHPSDRQRLAEAISGFGNSEGGVLVWGIDCTEVATERQPLVDVQRFVSWIERAISGCTVPPHGNIRNHGIVRAGSATGGFVATLVPKSDYAPHQVTGRNQYYIRAGSSFMPAPHAVLAGMFGRRPQPNVICQFITDPADLMAPSQDGVRKVRLRLGIFLRNAGPGIARDVFLNLRVWRVGSKGTRVAFDPANQETWLMNLELGRFFSLISQSHVRLPPEGALTATTIDVTLAPPFTDDIRIQGNLGCSGAPAVKLELGTTQKQLTEDYNLLIEWADCGMLTRDRLYRFVARVFGIEEGLRSATSAGTEASGGPE